MPEDKPKRILKPSYAPWSESNPEQDRHREAIAKLSDEQMDAAMRLLPDSQPVPEAPPSTTPSSPSDEPLTLAEELMERHGLSREKAEAWAAMI